MLNDPRFDGSISDASALEAFKRLEPTLASFAERNDLFVRRYLENHPIWGFFFRHPQDGTGMIQIAIGRDRSGAEVISAAGVWYVDDQRKLVRTRFSTPNEVVRSSKPKDVSETLDDLLQRLVTAPASARSEVSRIMERQRDESGGPIYSDWERALRYPKR